MARWSIAEGWQKARSLYGRERTASKLMESREKSIIELGRTAHHKLKAGQIADPELAAISHTVDGWDRMLGDLLDRREDGGGSAPSSADAADSHDRTGGPGAETGDSMAQPVDSTTGAGDSATVPRGPATGIRAQERAGRDDGRPLWKHGIFGAVLSVILMFALCVALSTVANRLIDQGIAAGRAAAADKVQSGAGQVKEKLEEAKPGSVADGKLGERAADKIRDTLQSKWSALSDFQSEADFDLLDVPLTYLLAHNVESRAILHFGGNAASHVNVQVGLYALLLLPLIAFLVGGFAAAWRMRVRSAGQALWLAVVIGAANALFLALLTQMSGFSAAVDLPGGLGSVGVGYRFSAASALLNGFVVGAAFSLCGAMLRLAVFRWGTHFRNGGIPYGEPIWRAAKAVMYGVGLSLLYALILLWSKGALSAVLVLLLPQLAAYLWGIANGNVFHMTNLFVGQGKQIEVSVFAGIHGTGMRDYAADWNVFIMLSALLPIVLLLVAGMRMKADADNPSRTALVFGVVYAGLMTVLSVLLQIGLNVRGSAAFINTRSVTLEAGFSALATFVTSFIVAYVFATAGMRWKRRRQSTPRDRSAAQEGVGPQA